MSFPSRATHNDGAPGTERTWVDWTGLVLCSLALTGAIIQAGLLIERPTEGAITDLTPSTGASACTYIGRIPHCESDIDFDSLDPASNPLDSAPSCRRIEFRAPGHLFAGTDCVDEETWRELELGDYYSAKTA